MSEMYVGVVERPGALEARASVERLRNKLGAVLINAELLAEVADGFEGERAKAIMRATGAAVDELALLGQMLAPSSER